MPGLTPQKAFEDFRKPIDEAVRCLHPSIRLRERWYAANKSVYLGSPQATGIPFKANNAPGYKLELQFQLNVVSCDEGFRMSTNRYIHEIKGPRSDVRVAAWHWHPDVKNSSVAYPHFHLPDKTPFSTKHFPSGRITVEEIIRFVITEMEAEPTNNRWAESLDESEALHKLHRSW